MECVLGENIELAIKEAAKYKNKNKLSELEMPIAIPTVDINDGRQYVFTNSEKLQGMGYIQDIEIAKAVRASSSFPVLYAPLRYEEHQFVDGGVLNNVPAKQVKEMGADKVISVNFISEEETRKKRLI